MTIFDNYCRVQEKINEAAQKCGRSPSSVTLVAVTKNHPISHVQPAYDAGCRNFGESRVQEALDKMVAAPTDLRWHFIGTLQKNKVRKVIGHFDLIHSIDTPQLVQKVSECSQEMKVETKILLQVNTSGEPSKHGLSPEEWLRNFELVWKLPGIHIQGLMTMAPFEAEEKVIRECFAKLRLLRDRLEAQVGASGKLPHLSMGMSHDYELAIQEGATLVRIGSAIFSSR